MPSRRRVIAAICGVGAGLMAARPTTAWPLGVTAGLWPHAGRRSSGAPMLTLPQSPIAQGGAFFVVLTGDGIVAATAEFAGRMTPAVREGDAWLAILASGQPVGSVQQLPAGTHPVRVYYELDGDRRRYRLEGTVAITPTEFPVEAITLAPQVASLLDPALIEQETAILRDTYTPVTPVRLWDGFFRRPSPAAITDVYGSRRSFNGGPATGSHSGVDFGAEVGAPVGAAAAGVVALAQPLPVRGHTVILDHGAGVYTGYCHLSAFAVQVGEAVRAGDRIGAVGATGLATGAHLHWEVVAGGMHVDGLRWLQA